MDGGGPFSRRDATREAGRTAILIKRKAAADVKRGGPRHSRDGTAPAVSTAAVGEWLAHRCRLVQCLRLDSRARRLQVGGRLAAWLAGLGASQDLDVWEAARSRPWLWLPMRRLVLGLEIRTGQRDDGVLYKKAFVALFPENQRDYLKYSLLCSCGRWKPWQCRLLYPVWPGAAAEGRPESIKCSRSVLPAPLSGDQGPRGVYIKPNRT